MGLRDRAAAVLKRLGEQIAPPRASAALSSATFGSGYEGAQAQRRLFGFRPTEASINSLLLTAGPMLRARARALVRNNGYARKAQRVFVSNLVGTGIRPVPRIDDAGLKATVATLWDDWTDEADADGLLDFYGMQVLVARALFDAGECFLRVRPRYARDNLTVPVQVQLLESEFCPYDMNRFAENGNIIRNGIEFNGIGQRVAYWFYKVHPGDYLLVSTNQFGWTRVPASDVIHVFEPIRPGQVRGVSWLAAAIVRAYILDQYDDAELERKKVAALFAGFIKKTGDSDAELPVPVGPQDQPVAGQADSSQNAPGEGITGLTPGMLQVLLQGEDITFSNPADVGGNYEAFEYRQLLALCASMDLPYSSVTGDRSKATYSSERASMLDMRSAIAQLQRNVMVFQLCRAMYRRVISEGVIAGELPIKAGEFNASPKSFNRARWVLPRREWVDPLKDVQADRIAVRSGFESREEVVLARGKTLEQLDSEIAAGNASSDALGLVLDSDPRLTDFRGSSNPPDTANPNPASDDDKNPDAAVTIDDEEEEAA
ncbi:MAG: phage portal protein [Alphaproteobacteria bacterium]|nr:phage portal protein [Alphaproteobacteria bacterium]MBL6939446.1 phage portal protein [Alphaproteobacteria bacterium]MBL7097073.1 phage portal protein [Alphaproteobacteria bacterium]